LAPPATAASPVAPGSPKVSVVTLAGTNVAYPEVAGSPAVNRQLLAMARADARSSPACQEDVVRVTPALASFRTTCGSQISTATFNLRNGRLLSLDDVFTGAWLAALSSAAVAQLRAGGAPAAVAGRVAGPVAANFSAWALDPDSLEVTFPLPGGPVTVDFPLASLSAYLRPGF
ncbi:MAG: hypothetical protein ACREQ5_23910, partial [Candidatus Dormibacteria bacterium]